LVSHAEGRKLRVFKNPGLRRISAPRTEEVTGGWIKLHNEELHIFYYSPYIIGMTKSRNLRKFGLVSGMETIKLHTKYFSEKLNWRGHLQDLCIDGRIILKLM
jgi:hypothetical protein